MWGIGPPLLGEASVEECQQLCSGAKTQLAARVNFFDPTDKLALARLTLVAELQNEGLSHHYLRLQEAGTALV